MSETAIAAGIRRIEAVTAIKADDYINRQLETLSQIEDILKNPKDVIKSVSQLLEQNSLLQKQIEDFQKEKAVGLKDELINRLIKKGDVNFLAEKVLLDANGAKNLAYAIKNEVENLFLVLAYESDGKPGIAVMIAENLVTEKKLNASTIVRELAKEINGSGGGQPFFATAGGKNADGIDNALQKAKEIIF